MLKRVGELYKKGYMLSVETAAVNETFFEIYGAALRFFAYCKVLDNVDRNAIEKLHENSMEVIAVHIEDEESYLRMKNFGCDAFEGYFFAQPKIVTSEEHNPSRMAVLQLYNKLMEDNSIDEVADEFEKNPEITVQLLQFVNSASFHFRTKIASIQQVIVLLGRLELAQWLMLMIYAKSVSSNTEMSPLMIMVKNRAELMQRVLKEVSPKIEKERVAEAYMVGVLSLMDTLFSMPLIEILDNLNVSAEVKDALLYDKGTLGDIYKFVRSLESMDGEGISDFELRYKVASQKIRTIVLDSLEVVAKLENPSENEV
jgi:EAL and modified HD-GYP domain-containing signal transduction protein